MNFRNWHKWAEMIALKTCPACDYQDLAVLVNNSGFCRFCLEQRARAARVILAGLVRIGRNLQREKMAVVQRRDFENPEFREVK